LRYALGVDLGTTYSAAAVGRDDRVAIETLGTASSAIPSVVVLRPDGEVLTGEAAERRAMADPTRTAREFKRRLGDPAPLILGGTPYGAEALQARLLRAIVDAVVQREGTRPSVIVLTHPANYGAYKRALLDEVVKLADVGEVVQLSEPEAAAIDYASRDRLEPGQVVAVYDFGGGTFDAAVLRKAVGGFELLGTPEGMEHLGGIDFDQAIFAHVEAVLGGRLTALDTREPGVRAALGRLREDCRTAKESLSADTDAVVPVVLPGISEQVRITRVEFEAMIRPRIGDTVTALERAVRSTGLSMPDVERVLLVGGSSRIPLVAELVGSATGRPVAVDAHPKHVVALGAARYGMARFGAVAATPVPPVVLGPAPGESSAGVSASAESGALKSTAAPAPSADRPVAQAAAAGVAMATNEIPSPDAPTRAMMRGRSRWAALLAVGAPVAIVAAFALIAYGGAAPGQPSATPGGAAATTQSDAPTVLPASESASATATAIAPTPSASLVAPAPTLVSVAVGNPCSRASSWVASVVADFHGGRFLVAELKLDSYRPAGPTSVRGSPEALTIEWKFPVSELKDIQSGHFVPAGSLTSWSIEVVSSRGLKASAEGEVKMVASGPGCP
jgi:actin-like ATPase involved in cell morphogenesis